MEIRGRCSLFILTCAVAGLLAASETPQDASPSIQKEIDRLQQSIKNQPIKDKDFGDIASSAGSALQAASQALQSGRLYLSLEKLGQGEDLLAGARAGVDKAALDGFEPHWGEASLRLTALDKEAHTHEWGKTPFAIRAIAESAQGKSIPLLDGARRFATANGPKDGLLSMGQAEGEASFSKFCASLNFASTKTKFPLRSFLPELQALQIKTNAAFQPPKSIDLHPRFIALNSTLKLAEELDSSRFYAGALYEYLEAVRHYGMLDAPPIAPAEQARFKEELAAAHRKIAESSEDDSIAQLFVERAQSQVAHADGSAPIPDEWRSARVILDQVLPAYYAARKPAGPPQKTGGKTVDITLVRWPYT